MIDMLIILGSFAAGALLASLMRARLAAGGRVYLWIPWSELLELPGRYRGIYTFDLLDKQLYAIALDESPIKYVVFVEGHPEDFQINVRRGVVEERIFPWPKRRVKMLRKLLFREEEAVDYCYSAYPVVDPEEIAMHIFGNEFIITGDRPVPLLEMNLPEDVTRGEEISFREFVPKVIERLQEEGVLWVVPGLTNTDIPSLTRGAMTYADIRAKALNAVRSLLAFYARLMKRLEDEELRMITLAALAHTYSLLVRVGEHETAIDIISKMMGVTPEVARAAFREIGVVIERPEDLVELLVKTAKRVNKMQTALSEARATIERWAPLPGKKKEEQG